MTIKRTLGGDRLGSGRKMTVDMKTYERSTHDLSYIWRSTMAPGTLVPFMTELGLPGDTFDIKLDTDIMTHPTVGPLFGSYKVQLDVFLAPIRLYQAQLHNNKLGIGLNMASIMLPQLNMRGTNALDETKSLDNQQIEPSCIFSYLNIRGMGQFAGTQGRRYFNALPYLSYWDIYKNYYANRQEEIGAVIHSTKLTNPQTVTTIDISGSSGFDVVPKSPLEIAYTVDAATMIAINYEGEKPLISGIMLVCSGATFQVDAVFGTIDDTSNPIICSDPITVPMGDIKSWEYNTTNYSDGTPEVYTFPLENLDEMREAILADVASTTAFEIDEDGIEPYSLPLKFTGTDPNTVYSKQTKLEGLALKTYQSDLFNNWLQTEWMDGSNGITEVTSVDTSGGSFTIDSLNLSKKVYDMLNRIYTSGGSYKDWIDTVYTSNSQWNAETPMYMGGLIKELVFQEVISNAEATNENGTQPLGTLAGRGVMGKKHKGGNITVKVTEPSYIMGIISLTPRLDYSQGNKWDVNLKTMDDLHKPALDEIGFQDLITDQMAWWDTEIGDSPSYTVTFKSAGKQPAWINYMTNVNQVRGNFAIEGNEMFMTLNRRYEYDTSTDSIKDLTTYIDPVKFNDIFADTSRDAQNFWTQIGVDITARRKMSAKIIPNL